MGALNAKKYAILAAAAAALGFIFAAYSTYDYAIQLDRQVHAVHCSFIPGVPASTDADNPCKTALFSPYSALFRASWWGGIPISVFALGAFGFFVGFALYLALGEERAGKRAYEFFAAVSVIPVGVSLVMFFVSAFHLHTFCKLCVGIYVSSIVMAVGAVLAWRAYVRDVEDLGRAATAAAPQQRVGPAPQRVATAVGDEGWGRPLLWLAALGACAVLPAIVYVSALPDYRPLLDKCGKLAVASEPHGALLKIPTGHPTRAVTLFEDPLCPTCKAFHERLVDEGIFERLDVTMAMFPLDSDCNWMLDRSLHPGACVVAKAVICGGTERARSILEWAYAEQEDLREAGKQSSGALTQKIADRWGGELATCVANKATAAKLNQHLHYAANNHIPVSTPQMFLGDKRICDEDTDLGLKYTLAQLAPEVLQ